MNEQLSLEFIIEPIYIDYSCFEEERIDRQNGTLNFKLID